SPARPTRSPTRAPKPPRTRGRGRAMLRRSRSARLLRALPRTCASPTAARRRPIRSAISEFPTSSARRPGCSSISRSSSSSRSCATWKRSTTPPRRRPKVRAESDGGRSPIARPRNERKDGGGRRVGARRRRASPRRLTPLLLAIALTAAHAGIAAAGPPGVWVVQSWDQLTPDQRSRALQNFQRYQRLPESSRERLQRRYHTFQGLPPREQEQVRKNYDVYRNMTPDQRQDFMNRYQQWKGKQ